MKTRTIYGILPIVVVMLAWFAPSAHARVYDPTTGRWLERDPLGTRPEVARIGDVPGGFGPMSQYNDGMNLYAAFRHNPVRYGDWDGQKVCTPASGSLRLMMEKYAKQFSPFTSSGNADPKKRITWQVLSCIACQESSFNPCAINRDDPADPDTGLMQLRMSGALGQCVKDGILRRPDPAEFNDARRNQCCGIDKQPHYKKGDDGKVVKDRDCAKRCDDSIWNVENQLECAAHYLRYLRDKQKETWTLEMMLCQYNKGLGDPRCLDPAKAKGVDYVKSVMECLNGLDTVKPGEGVISPPKEWE